MIDFEGLSKGTSSGHYLTAMAFAKSLMGRERGGGSKYDKEYFENAAKLEEYKSTLRREEERNKTDLGDEELSRLPEHLTNLRGASQIKDADGNVVGQHSFSWGTTKGNRGSFSGYMHEAKEPEDGDGDTSDDVDGYDAGGSMDDSVVDDSHTPEEGSPVHDLHESAKSFIPMIAGTTLPVRPERQTLTHPETGRQMRNPAYHEFKGQIADQLTYQQRQFDEYHASRSGLDSSSPLDTPAEPKE